MNHIKVKDILNKYNLKSSYYLFKILKKNNIKIHKIGTPRIIKYNRDKFLNFYPETIYWFGFIYADGCLLKPRSTYQLQLVLAEKDKNMIERFIEYFEIENLTIKNKIIYNKKTNKKYASCKIILSLDQEIVNFMKYFGIIHRKSLVSYYPAIFDTIENKESLVKNYIRGVFDGDGGVCLFNKPNSHGKKSNLAISISWLGNYELLEWMQSQMKSYLDVEHIGKIGKRTNTYGFTWGKKELTLKFYNWIYDENEFCMDRKKEKIKYFIENKTII